MRNSSSSSATRFPETINARPLRAGLIHRSSIFSIAPWSTFSTGFWRGLPVSWASRTERVAWPLRPAPVRPSRHRQEGPLAASKQPDRSGNGAGRQKWQPADKVQYPERRSAQVPWRRSCKQNRKQALRHPHVKSPQCHSCKQRSQCAGRASARSAGFSTPRPSIRNARSRCPAREGPELPR